MTDRPIIFSAPMVRALLDGRKTQTRRKLPAAHPKFPNQCHLSLDVLSDPQEVWYWDGKHDRVGASYRLPYAAGDRLYVREAHAILPRTAYCHSVGIEQREHPTDGYSAAVFREGFDRATTGIRWRPSIHMPRWASRLTLAVTDVRVQRLQEIGAEDAISEGIARFDATNMSEDESGPVWRFAELWNSLHGPDAFDENPWVVAIGFDVHRCNIDQMTGSA